MQLKIYTFFFLGIIAVATLLIVVPRLKNFSSGNELGLIAEVSLKTDEAKNNNQEIKVSAPDNSSSKENIVSSSKNKKTVKSSVAASDSVKKIASNTANIPQKVSEPLNVVKPQQNTGQNNSNAVNQNSLNATSSGTATVIAEATSTSINNSEVAPITTLETTSSSTPEPVSNVSHILISEIQITGGSGKTDNDFIELWNPSGNDVDLSGWQLKKKTKSGTESSIRQFPDGLKIPAHGFFLWANSKDGFADSIQADVNSTSYLSSDYSIRLYDKDDALIDSVAWGENSAEGSAISTDLEANQSYERKAWENSGCVSSSGAYEVKGNGCDTENNVGDFEVRSVSNPQNSKSAIE